MQRALVAVRPSPSAVAASPSCADSRRIELVCYGLIALGGDDANSISKGWQMCVVTINSI